MSPSRRDVLKTAAAASLPGLGPIKRPLEVEPEPFQKRLEELGVMQHWTKIPKDARFRREKLGQDHEEAFEVAVRSNSRRGVDVAAVRGEFVNEQWQLVKESETLYVELPEEVEPIVERRLYLLGLNPDDVSIRDWADAALDVVEFRFERERQE